MREERRQGLAPRRDPYGRRPCPILSNQVGQLEEGRPKTDRESNQPVVLRDGRAGHTGKGLTGIRSLHRKRVFLKSPVRENRTPGSVRGRLGNWPSYRDGGITYVPKGRRKMMKKVCVKTKSINLPLLLLGLIILILFTLSGTQPIAAQTGFEVFESCDVQNGRDENGIPYPNEIPASEC
jgi:hypothetical protein